MDSINVNIARYKNSAGYYECSGFDDNCTYKIKHTSNFRRHILTHTGEKPHKCTVCHKDFRHTYHLNTHIRTHTGEKPYKCEHATCGKSFSKKFNLKQHRLIHTGEKPYKCTLCSEAFRHNHHLSRHILTHTGEKPHKCTECPQAFTTNQNFKRHQQKKHAKQTPFETNLQACNSVANLAASSSVNYKRKAHSNDNDNSASAKKVKTSSQDKQNLQEQSLEPNIASLQAIIENMQIQYSYYKHDDFRKITATLEDFKTASAANAIEQWAVDNQQLFEEVIYLLEKLCVDWEKYANDLMLEKDRQILLQLTAYFKRVAQQAKDPMLTSASQYSPQNSITPDTDRQFLEIREQQLFSNTETNNRAEQHQANSSNYSDNNQPATNFNDIVPTPTEVEFISVDGFQSYLANFDNYLS